MHLFLWNHKPKKLVNVKLISLGLQNFISSICISFSSCFFTCGIYVIFGLDVRFLEWNFYFLDSNGRETTGKRTIKRLWKSNMLIFWVEFPFWNTIVKFMTTNGTLLFVDSTENFYDSPRFRMLDAHAAQTSRLLLTILLFLSGMVKDFCFWNISIFMMCRKLFPNKKLCIFQKSINW